MKIFPQNFRRFFTEPPNSVEELFENITNCMYMIDQNWQSNCKPAPKEDIEYLDNFLVERFGRGIPASYRTYLELMGEEDGGLVSLKMDDPEFWNYFKGDNMAQGAVRYIEDLDKYSVQYERNTQKPCPISPIWNLYYTAFTGCGWGFSPKTKCSDQMIEAHGITDFFFTPDTFSQFLFYCVYASMINQIWKNSTEFYQPIYKLPSDIQNTCLCWMSLSCPREWSFPNSALLVNFLKEIEESCCIEECWFSSQKDLNLWNPDGTSSEYLYEFARYEGYQSFNDLSLSMKFERDCEETTIRAWIISQDTDSIRWVFDEISKRITEIKKMTVKYMN